MKLKKAIKYITTRSVTNHEDAKVYMNVSNDYKRDAFIVVKLSNIGMGIRRILPILNALNDKTPHKVITDKECKIEDNGWYKSITLNTPLKVGEYAHVVIPNSKLFK